MFKDHPDLVTLALQPPDCPQAVTEGTDIFSFEDPAVKSALLVQAFGGIGRVGGGGWKESWRFGYEFVSVYHICNAKNMEYGSGNPQEPEFKSWNT